MSKKAILLCCAVFTVAFLAEFRAVNLVSVFASATDMEIVGGVPLPDCNSSDHNPHLCQTLNPMFTACAQNIEEYTFDGGQHPDELSQFKWTCMNNNCVNEQLDVRKDGGCIIPP